MKKRALKDEKRFFYIFFVATRSDSRGRGLCSALIRHCQRVAEAENYPLWLEATTAHSRDVYAKEGFKVAEQVVLGEGQVDADGKTKKNGEGVTVWGMVWRSEKNDAAVTDGADGADGAHLTLETGPAHHKVHPDDRFRRGPAQG